MRVYGVNLGRSGAPGAAGLGAHECLLHPAASRRAPGPSPRAPDTVVSPSDGPLEELGYADADQLAAGQAVPLPARGSSWRWMTAEAGPFSGGATATIYLAPHDYHRVHMPLGGRVTGMVYVPGRRWAVNRRTVRTVPGLFAANERVILWCETRAGRFAVVLVGALNVASISLAWCGEVPAGRPGRPDRATRQRSATADSRRRPARPVQSGLHGRDRRGARPDATGTAAAGRRACPHGHPAGPGGLSPDPDRPLSWRPSASLVTLRRRAHSCSAPGLLCRPRTSRSRNPRPRAHP